jgi:hypothetical protein
MLMWFAPPTVAPEAPNAAQMRALIGKYVFIGLTHGHFDKTIGTVTFDETNTLEAKDGSGKPLVLVDRSSLPPATLGAVTVIERIFQQSFGAFGRGMKMFVFEAGDVNACEKGELAIPFAGETYTWETPFPGCT